MGPPCKVSMCVLEYFPEYAHVRVCVRETARVKVSSHAYRGKGLTTFARRNKLTTFARRNKACVSSLLYILKLGLSPEVPTQYSETWIIAIDSHSNRLKSEDTEYNLLVY